MLRLNRRKIRQLPHNRLAAARQGRSTPSESAMRRGAGNSDPEGQKNMATQHGDTSYFCGDTPTYGRHTHVQKTVRFGKIWVFLVEEPARTKVGSDQYLSRLHRNNDGHQEPECADNQHTAFIRCGSEYPPVNWDGMTEVTQHLRRLLVSPTSWLLSNAAAVRCVHFPKTS